MKIKCVPCSMSNDYFPLVYHSLRGWLSCETWGSDNLANLMMLLIFFVGMPLAAISIGLALRH